jgi:hypothetical protein
MCARESGEGVLAEQAKLDDWRGASGFIASSCIQLSPRIFCPGVSGEDKRGKRKKKIY